MNFKKSFKHLIKGIGRMPVVLNGIGLLAYVYTLLVGKTGKFEVRGIDELAKMFRENNGGIFVAWHGRALMLPYFWHDAYRVKALVSPHYDGRIIARLLKCYNILSIDGSSDKRANVAAVEIVKELKQETAVAIIPDGPRGPNMRLNKSVIYFAKKTGKPIMGVTYSSQGAGIFHKSWDKMLLPKLFKKGVVYGTKPLFVAKDADEDEMERLRLALENELNELTLKADKECGLPLIAPGEIRKKHG